MTVVTEWMRLRAAIQRERAAERRAQRLAVLLHEQTDLAAALHQRLEALQRANEGWERRCASCERARQLRVEDPWADVGDGWAE